MRIYKAISSVCLGLALAGCASVSGVLYSKKVYIYYPGTVLPLEDVAVISYVSGLTVTVADSNGNNIKPIQIYGKSGLYGSGPNQYHFLPGVYNFSFGLFLINCTGYSVRGQCSQWLTSRSTSDINKVITLKKGDVLSFGYSGSGSHWSPEIRDNSSELDKIKANYEEAIKHPLPLEQHD